MTKKITVLLGLMLSAFFVNGQDQEEKILVAEKMIDGVNSACEELRPILSEDGTTIYFVRNLCENRGGFGQSIWMSKKLSNGEWSRAVLPEVINTRANNAPVGINSETGALYLIDVYPKSKLGSGKGITEAKMSEEGKWEIGERVFSIKQDLKRKKISGYVDYFVSGDGNVMFLSMSPKKGEGSDLFITRRGEDGKWLPLTSLGEKVNTAGSEFSPFLSRDGNTLFFATDGREGLGGVDLYKTVRLSENWDEWSEPENLGEPYNSSGFDAYYFENPHGQLFSSNRGAKLADIYVIEKKVAPKEDELLADKKSENEEQEGLALEDDNKGSEKDKKEDIEIKKDGIRIFGGNKLANSDVPEPIMVYFGFNHAYLTPEDMSKLKKKLESIESPEKYTVAITGHADYLGTEEYNQRLSEKRAKTISKLAYALNYNIGSVVGKGEAEPAIKGTDEAARKMCRRVEIFFEKGKSPQ
ncbi:hypothetical protein FUAX_16440 [Fulvitalea axinellae]|uniref:OmpA-like domain-containing protein n=2 Tax=Fulvitalea axinellae TaxID=1182444 RepID=A0AAU9CQH5_9BACT|nr:hypothetical protein FUAX_16440 [Fulvitalea axinellae]